MTTARRTLIKGAAALDSVSWQCVDLPWHGETLHGWLNAFLPHNLPIVRPRKEVLCCLSPF